MFLFLLLYAQKAGKVWGKAHSAGKLVIVRFVHSVRSSYFLRAPILECSTVQQLLFSHVILFHSLCPFGEIMTLLACPSSVHFSSIILNIKDLSNILSE